MSPTCISIVVPLYNEKDSLPFLIERLNKVMGDMSISIEVILVDDCSIDETPDIISQVALTDDRYLAIILAKNHGHQLAITAGLANANATEAVLVMDADLQDPPEMLRTFYEHFKNGYDVVYGKRTKRKENWIKRQCYYLFYWLLKSISYIEIPTNSGDFSLISRRVVDIVNQMPEESRFLRGMRSWIGFKQIGIDYERDERCAGNSKYSFGKLIQLAYNGIFNFSAFPVKFITRIGVATILISFIYLIVALINKYFYGNVPQGFTGLLIVITLFSGVQLLSLGVIGEYVLRIFFQVKKRPLFIIKQKIAKQENVEILQQKSSKETNDILC